jgi:hypothetical protein
MWGWFGLKEGGAIMASRFGWILASLVASVIGLTGLGLLVANTVLYSTDASSRFTTFRVLAVIVGVIPGLLALLCAASAVKVRRPGWWLGTIAALFALFALFVAVAIIVSPPVRE